MVSELEKLAKARTREFMRLYTRARDKRKAYKIYLKVAFGELTYEQALRELRRLAHTQH